MARKVVIAWLSGIGVVFASHAAWLALVSVGIYSEQAVLLLWLSPLVGGFISAYLAPCNKISVGTSMGVVNAISASVANTIFQWADGSVDFVGYQGARDLFLLVLIYGLILAILGSFGAALADKKA